MKRKILILLLGLNFVNISAQTKYWISTYEISKNSPDLKRYSDANRVFIKQNKDSLKFYDVGKEEFKDKFKTGFSYHKKTDSLIIKPFRKIKLKGTEKNDTLKIHTENGTTYTFNLLTKPKIKRKKIEKIIYSKKFEIDAKELYRQFSDGRENKTVRFSNQRTENDNVFWAKIQEIDGHFFFSLSTGPEKIFPIMKIRKKHILLFAPNKRNNIATLKIVK